MVFFGGRGGPPAGTKVLDSHDRPYSASGTPEQRAYYQQRAARKRGLIAHTPAQAAPAATQPQAPQKTQQRGKGSDYQQLAQRAQHTLAQAQKAQLRATYEARAAGARCALGMAQLRRALHEQRQQKQLAVLHRYQKGRLA